MISSRSHLLQGPRAGLVGAAMASVLARLVDHALALRAQQATGFESPESREEQLRGFLNALSGVNLSGPEIVALVAVVGPHFPEAVSALQKEQTTRCRLQDFQNLIHFFKYDQWAAFADRRGQPSGKLEVLLQHAVNLGLRHPSEQTLQTLVTLWLVSVFGADQVVCMPWSSKLQHLHMVKAAWKKVIAREPPPKERVETLPSEPAAFKKEFPSQWEVAFPSDAPIGCPVSEAAFRALQDGIPMRITNRRSGAEGTPFWQSQAEQLPSSLGGHIALANGATLHMLSPTIARTPMLPVPHNSSAWAPVASTPTPLPRSVSSASLSLVTSSPSALPSSPSPALPLSVVPATPTATEALPSSLSAQKI